MRKLLTGLLVLFALLQPAFVLAAPANANEAREHFKRGTVLYDEADFRGALAEFKRAYEILPNPTVLFNIGQAYFQLNEYVAALETLQKYLEDKDPSGASRRALAMKELDELKKRVATVTIETNIPEATISIDDKELGPSPQTTIVAIGQRRITAKKEGYRPASRTVDFASGDAPPIVLELVEEKAAPPADVPISREKPEGALDLFISRPLLGGSFALSALGVVTGSIFGALALGNRSSLEERCTTKTACPDDARPEKEALERNGMISTIGFAVAIVAAGAGVAMLVLSPKAHR